MLDRSSEGVWCTSATQWGCSRDGLFLPPPELAAGLTANQEGEEPASGGAALYLLSLSLWHPWRCSESLALGNYEPGEWGGEGPRESSSHPRTHNFCPALRGPQYRKKLFPQDISYSLGRQLILSTSAGSNREMESLFSCLEPRTGKVPQAVQELA